MRSQRPRPPILNEKTTVDPLTLINSDCLTALRAMPADSVQCCVTSPPYYGLRDYGHAAQIGLEPTLWEFIDKMVEVFMEVHRVLRPDGTLWLNLGDSYASTWSCGRRNAMGNEACDYGKRQNRVGGGIKEKDLMGVPWRVAFALQDAGWYLRTDVVWHKPNPMTESVRDRPTRSHEFIFFLTKEPKYYYDAEAVKEIAVSDHGSGNGFKREARLSFANEDGTPRGNDKPCKAKGRTGKNAFRGQGHFRDDAGGPANREGRDMADVDENADGMRSRRDVWTVPVRPYKGAHFATYPGELITPCILAGTKPGDVVLDPFGGSGTTGQVALELGRRALLIELNPDYCEIIRQRCAITPGLALV